MTIPISVGVYIGEVGAAAGEVGRGTPHRYHLYDPLHRYQLFSSDVGIAQLKETTERHMFV